MHLRPRFRIAQNWRCPFLRDSFAGFLSCCILVIPRFRAGLKLAHTAGSCDLTAAVGDIASVFLCLPTLRMDNLCDGLVRFVDAPSLVFYAQRIGMNAIENDMKVIVLRVAVQCKNGKMTAAQAEIPF